MKTVSDRNAAVEVILQNNVIELQKKLVFQKQENYRGTTTTTSLVSHYLSNYPRRPAVGAQKFPHHNCCLNATAPSKTFQFHLDRFNCSRQHEIWTFQLRQGGARTAGAWRRTGSDVMEACWTVITASSNVEKAVIFKYNDSRRNKVRMAQWKESTVGTPMRKQETEQRTSFNNSRQRFASNHDAKLVEASERCEFVSRSRY